MPDETHEDECANCYHGVTLHAEAVPTGGGDFASPCTVPGCECADFVDPDEEVAL